MPCEHEDRSLSSSPSKPECLEKRSLTSRWRSPASSSSRARRTTVVAAGVTTTALPDASVARAGASAARATSYVDRLAAGAESAHPGTCSSVTLSEGGAGSYLSGRACLPSLSSFSPSPDDEYSDIAGGESPCCSRGRYSSSRYSRHSRCWILLSFLRAARSCSRCCAAHAAARAWGVGGSNRAASTVTLC
jgi:hypothetical protein